MPTLTRRRSESAHRETWNIFYGDIHVGTISERAGVPKNQDQWAWRCGLVGGGGRFKAGDGATYSACREAFQLAWDEIRPTLSEDQLEAWRVQRDWTAWKSRMHDKGLPLPTQPTSGRSRCFCGTEVKITDVDDHVRTAHRAMGINRARDA